MDEPWIAQFAAALEVDRDRVSDGNTHVSTSYRIRDGCRPVLIEAIADLVRFLYTGTEEASDPASWRTGGAVGRRSWERLTGVDEHGVHAEMKAVIGEAVAWWHETQCDYVVFAQRPHLGTSQPFVDSISIVACEDDQEVRGVQAKVTADAPRPRVLEAFRKFEKLQRGERDEYWSEAIRRLRREAGGDERVAVDFAGAVSGSTVRHVQTFVCHGTPPATDPAHDYDPRITAHAPHGRSIGLLHDPDINGLASEVAAVIRREVLG